MNFSFLDLEDEEVAGSEGRYQRRVKAFEEDKEPHPRLRHYIHWFTHNCIVHPILGVIPNQRTAELHQISSNWLNKLHPWKNLTRFSMSDQDSIPNPPKGKRRWWLLHNCVAHVAIGLLPIKPTFAFHDWSAKKMDVPGWV